MHSNPPDYDDRAPSQLSDHRGRHDHPNGGSRFSRKGPKTKPLTIVELYMLPAAVDLMTAARALNMGRTLAYELAKSGDFPCEVIRYGDAYRVPTVAIYRLLRVPLPETEEHEGKR